MTLQRVTNRLAFWLIGLLLTLLVLSAIIPQHDFARAQIPGLEETLGKYHGVIDTLGLNRIYYSPFFYTILGLLAINLLIGNLIRFRSVYRQERMLLRTRHLGSILFHLSLLLIMISIIVNYLYKHEGVFALTEGQQVEDRSEAYFREFTGPLAADEYGRFRIQLDKIDLNFPVDETEATAAFVSFWPPGAGQPNEETILTNNPLEYDGLEIHYGLTYGYSPELIISDRTGNQLFAGFVRLATQNIDNGPIFSDYYIEESSGLRVEMTVVPAQTPIDSSTVHLYIERAGAALIDREIGVGDTVEVENWKVTVPRLRHWCYLTVVDNPFLEWVIFGYWSALIGLAVSFVPRLFHSRKAI